MAWRRFCVNLGIGDTSMTAAHALPPRAIMTAVLPPPPHLPPGPCTAFGAVAAVAVGGALAIAGICPDAAVIGRTALGYLPIAALVIVGFALLRHGHDGFGPANWVTLSRAGLVCVLLGLTGAAASDGVRWTAAAIGLGAFALDGIDGWIARRTGTVSAFGAAFDREVDALFVLVLALLAMHLADLGPWVLAAGLLRYAFVAARWAWPWLGAGLPARWRRKAAFGVSVMLLLAALMPPAAPVAFPLAGAALAVLAASFAADVLWLYRQEPGAPRVQAS